MRIWISWHRLFLCPGVRIYQLNCEEHRFIGAFMDHGDACDLGRAHRWEHHMDTVYTENADGYIPESSDVATRAMRRLLDATDAKGLSRV